MTCSNMNTGFNTEHGKEDIAQSRVAVCIIRLNLEAENPTIREPALLCLNNLLGNPDWENRKSGRKGSLPREEIFFFFLVGTSALMRH